MDTDAIWEEVNRCRPRRILNNKIAGDTHEAARRKVRNSVWNEPCHPNAYADSRITSYNVCYTKLLRDGNGITYENAPVVPGKSVVVDDELLIYLVKDLLK